MKVNLKIAEVKGLLYCSAKGEVMEEAGQTEPRTAMAGLERHK